MIKFVSYSDIKKAIEKRVDLNRDGNSKINLRSIGYRKSRMETPDDRFP